VMRLVGVVAGIGVVAVVVRMRLHPMRVAVIVRVVVRVFVRVIVVVVVRMRVVVRVTVVVRVRWRFGELALFENVDLHCGDAGAIHPLDAQRSTDIEDSGGLFEHRTGNARIEQGREHHVSGNTGKAVKIGNTHALPT
jgi:hypothetical protein